MSKKRSNNEGTVVYVKSRKSYRGRMFADGKQRWVSGKTKSEVITKISELKTAIATGVDITSNGSIKDLASKYLKIAERGVNPKTFRSYETQTRVHIIPHLGNIKIKALSTARVNNLVDDLLKTNSASSVNRTLATLSRIMHHAIKLNYIHRNPVSFADKPKHTPKKINPFNRVELNAFLNSASSDPHYALWYLMVNSGLRFGEILALKWSDLNMETGELTINKSFDEKFGIGDTKTYSSTRKITLNYKTLTLLRVHQAKQLEQVLDLAGYYENNSLIFPSVTGSYMNPSNLRNRSFNKILKDAGLSHRTPHQLRHSFASLLLMQGASPLRVSGYLGHADMSITLKTYGHYIPAEDTSLADGIESLIEG